MINLSLDNYNEKIVNVSEILKTIGHPARLCIVCRLMVKEHNVSQMQNCLNLPQSTISQHLSILKSKGIIEGTRNGTEIIYSLKDDNVRKIINSIFTLEEIPIIN